MEVSQFYLEELACFEHIDGIQVVLRDAKSGAITVVDVDDDVIKYMRSKGAIKQLSACKAMQWAKAICSEHLPRPRKKKPVTEDFVARIVAACNQFGVAMEPCTDFAPAGMSEQDLNPTS